MSHSSELSKTYERRFQGTLTYRDRVWQVLVRHVFSRYIPPDSTVLDLGCGYGQFINAVECKSKLAMDMNPDTRTHLRSDVHFLQQDCSTTWPLANGELDVVFTSNFLEHLPSKSTVSSTLAEAYRCLRPGGRFIAMGPNIKYVPGAYWDFFDHYVALTELSLQEALELNGFRAERVVDRFLPYTMVNAPEYPISFLVTYVHLPFVWRFFGKQFLVVAQRK